ncbi:MAG: 7-carboxy-7-deazaguanine synthase QueE [Syntrophomonadaceae bacterium]
MKPGVKSGGGRLRASLNEIMESIQGEGLLVGSRNIFVRFSGCNLRCSYCDTPSSLDRSDFCRFNPVCGGYGEWQQITNPLSVNEVIQLISGFRSRWISLTGGEPLIWADFIAKLGGRLRPNGYRFLLETNGTLYEELTRCIEYMDLISMDYKLPSATGIDCSQAHNEFLKQAKDKALYVKIVVDSNTETIEIRQALQIIVQKGRNTTLFLQPASPFGEIKSPPIRKLLDMQHYCLGMLDDVRILPQLHRQLQLI